MTNIELWNEIKVLVEALELDVAKNARGNGSAGIRARHGLRLLQKKSAALTKLMLETDHTNRRAREQQKAAGRS